MCCWVMGSSDRTCGKWVGAAIGVERVEPSEIRRSNVTDPTGPLHRLWPAPRGDFPIGVGRYNDQPSQSLGYGQGKNPAGFPGNGGRFDCEWRRKPRLAGTMPLGGKRLRSRFLCRPRSERRRARKKINQARPIKLHRSGLATARKSDGHLNQFGATCVMREAPVENVNGRGDFRSWGGW